MGNIAPSDAVDVARALKSEIGAAALAADAAPLPASVEIAPSAEGCVPLRVEKMIDDEKNVGLELHLHLGEPTVAEEARLLVLSQVASKDAFNVLRTQKQLGYVVQCGTRSIARARGLSVLVQSAVASPPELEAEVASLKETVASLEGKVSALQEQSEKLFAHVLGTGAKQ
mgnify:CR=1 FL=1